MEWKWSVSWVLAIEVTCSPAFATETKAECNQSLIALTDSQNEKNGKSQKLSLNALTFLYVPVTTASATILYGAGELLKPYIKVLDHHSNFTTGLIVSSVSFLAISSPLFLIKKLNNPFAARMVCYLNTCFVAGAGTLYEVYQNQLRWPGSNDDIPDLISAAMAGVVSGAYSLFLVHKVSQGKLPRFMRQLEK
jgi:hypothetical protein